MIYINVFVCGVGGWGENLSRIILDCIVGSLHIRLGALGFSYES